MRPLIVDSFAGGGGASTGIEMALGRSPDIAINHSADALAMHAVNHPDTHHLNSNIWDVSPLEVTGGRAVGLFWASPDCKHFSKAKGGKPLDRNIRDLAWVVVRWAEEARPDVIILENVEEFVTWGPLYEDGSPIVELRGQTFQDWVRRLKRAGYRVQWRELRACDYGAPTIRKRFFLIARRDGKPIVWPAPTHYPSEELLRDGYGNPDDPAYVPRPIRKRERKNGKPDYSKATKPWRTAAEIIDWSLPCPSIFDTSAEIMAKHGVRAVRPLADATMRRIARGVVRYVLETAKPFVVKFQTGSTGHALDEPLATVTANGFVKRPGGAAPIGIVVPSIAALAHGYSGGRREYSIEEPLGTVHAGGNNHALVAPVITAAQQGGSVRSADAPIHTITASPKDQNAVIAATMVQTGYGEREGQAPRALDIDRPIGTQVGGAAKHAVVAAFLAQHNNDSRRVGGVNPGRRADEPIATITAAGAQQAVVAAHLNWAYTSNTRGGEGDLDLPAKTFCAGGNHAALIAGFLTKYYGEGLPSQSLAEPVHTVTTKPRHGLVTVEIDGETFAIADIGMRMLTPRERFRAQGFPDSYVIDRRPDGSAISATVQGSCCGNSVCPPLAAALVAANCAGLAAEPVREAAE
ncbi:DNA cytosine methyltransferase [Mangrovibrevibacter kandeliae]|uniref:DNA cytosine methyltransferase n=1 Tax=Mangrovibrevibacter kandeliae TaxID=2968473 RepID=UPI0021176542|nr:DNA cytosine methyltransferase [Aurantimonas sp. CSK15Z-1]MCQ8781682.1 DNA cytosine methyltransferase [Aurantimonas sp. CSK15Z-1]